MLNKSLVARAAARLKNPTKRTPDRDSMLLASMAAESLKMEGVNTSAKEVLASAGVRKKIHAVA